MARVDMSSDESHDVDMATGTRIGTRIKRARERQLMSQEELAAKLRVSRSAVNSWERDRSYPRNRIGALEEVLGIVLAGDAEPEAEPESEWERWERSVLTNPHLPRDVAEAMVRDARDARDAYQAGSSAGRPGGSSSGPSRPSAAAAG